MSISPDNLLWHAPSRGGLTAHEWERVVDHLTSKLADSLGVEIQRGSDASIATGKSLGFSVNFWTPNPIALPLCLNARGTFGASHYDGTKSTYIGVQGWLYPYLIGKRVATTESGHNHVFMRYAKSDAADEDWEMSDAIGESA